MRSYSLIILALVFFLASCGVTYAPPGSSYKFEDDEENRVYDELMSVDSLDCVGLGGMKVDLNVRSLANFSLSKPQFFLEYLYGMDSSIDRPEDLVIGLKNRVSRVLGNQCGVIFTDQSPDLELDITVNDFVSQTIDVKNKGDSVSQICALPPCKWRWDIEATRGSLLDISTQVRSDSLGVKNDSYRHNLTASIFSQGVAQEMPVVGKMMNQSTRVRLIYDEKHQIVNMTTSKSMKEFDSNGIGLDDGGGKVEFFDQYSGKSINLSYDYGDYDKTAPWSYKSHPATRYAQRPLKDRRITYLDTMSMESLGNLKYLTADYANKLAKFLSSAEQDK